ncbi:MAG: DUF3090 family protein [Acidimicrobiales bacterium]|nr:DUF3090 family protein [Acidimicrobiales bacterium]
MSASFHFENLAYFTTGTVGPKGQRIFFLQAQGDDGQMCVRLEKQQVAALADYLEQVITQADPSITASSDIDLNSAGELLEPTVPEWVVGGMSLAYNEDRQHVIVIAEELRGDEDDDSEFAAGDSATARFSLTFGQARAFISRARDVVADGRDPCPFCSRPLAPGDAWCPCSN